MMLPLYERRLISGKATTADGMADDDGVAIVFPTTDSRLRPFVEQNTDSCSTAYRKKGDLRHFAEQNGLPADTYIQQSIERSSIYDCHWSGLGKSRSVDV